MQYSTVLYSTALYFSARDWLLNHISWPGPSFVCFMTHGLGRIRLSACPRPIWPSNKASRSQRPRPVRKPRGPVASCGRRAAPLGWCYMQSGAIYRRIETFWVLQLHSVTVPYNFIVLAYFAGSCRSCCVQALAAKRAVSFLSASLSAGCQRYDAATAPARPAAQQRPTFGATYIYIYIYHS